MSTTETEQDAQRGDNRQITSPVNGLKGGRPPSNPRKWADIYFKHRQIDAVDLTNTGTTVLTPSVLVVNNNWYRYEGTHWHSASQLQIQNDLVTDMQRSDDAVSQISNNMVKNIMLNLRSEDYCEPLSKGYRNPCLLATGEDATGCLVMKNGIINLNELDSGSKDPLHLYPHSPQLFTTFAMDYEYDPNASCPKWEKYLAETQPLEENREMLQMLAGLSLIPDTSYNVAFFLYGNGGTGKSVFCDVLAAFIGAENYCCVPLANFKDRFGTGPLTEKLLNIVSELPEHAERATASDIARTFKAVTSGDEIKVERKNIDSWSARVTARLVFACNTLPMLPDSTDGVWDRIRIIPFNTKIRGTETQNPHLAEEVIAEELPGIFNWALEGLRKLKLLRVFPECTEGKELREQLRRDCDQERTFLEEMIIPAPGYCIPSMQLYEEYKDWNKAKGSRPAGQDKLTACAKRLYSAEKLGKASYREVRATGTGETFRGAVISGITWSEPGEYGYKRFCLAGRRLQPELMKTYNEPESKPCVKDNPEPGTEPECHNIPEEWGLQADLGF